MATLASPSSAGWSREVGRSQWGWFLALGISYVVFGLIASANLFLATVASVLLIGALMLVAGIGQIVHAFRVRTWGGFAFWLLSGLLYAAGGLLAVINPVLASVALTLLFAASLVGAGIVRMFMAFRIRPATGWGWLLFGGLVTTLAGLFLGAYWPVNSLVVLGIFLAVDLLMQGVALIVTALGLRRLAA